MQSHSGVSDYEPLAGRRSAALTRCCRLSAPRRRPRVPLRIVTTDGLRRLDRLQYIEDHSHYLDQLVGLKWVQLINATSGTPSEIDENGRRYYRIRAIPYQDPQQEAESQGGARSSGQDRHQGLSRGSVTEGSFSPARASGLVHNVTGSREAAPWSNNRVTMLRVPSNPRSKHPSNRRSNRGSNRPSRSRRRRPSSTCNRPHGPRSSLCDMHIVRSDRLLASVRRSPS